jgi:CRISPR-associated protein Cmr1
MFKKEVSLEVVTPMFSTRANKKAKFKIAEFRITELKALLRSTFREFFEYSSIDDLKESEAILFGSTEIKSPVSIMFQEKIEIKCVNEVLIYRNNTDFKQNALKSGNEINLIFQSRNKEILELYMFILQLASITGGLGKRSRKAMGSFKITGVEKDINLEDLVQSNNNNPISFYINSKNLKGVEKKYVFKLRKFIKIKDIEDKDDYIRYKIEYKNGMPNIHYVKHLHKIGIKNSNDSRENILSKISYLTHERLINYKNFISSNTPKIAKNLNKEILGNIPNGNLSRFASPVYITIHQQKENTYVIIKELNFDYIYDGKKLTRKDLDSQYISGFINRIKEICEEMKS